MKKIKINNKLLNSLTLLSPLASIGFNNQYQTTKKVITENSRNSLSNYFSSNSQEKMGDITVNVDGTIITGYVEGEGVLKVTSNITEIGNSSFKSNENITFLDLSDATSLTTIADYAFYHSTKILNANLYLPNVETIGNAAFSGMAWDTGGFSNVDLTLGENLKSIGLYAFQYCHFKNLNLSSNNKNFTFVTNLGPNAKVLILGTDTVWKETSWIVGSIATGDLIIPNNISFIQQYAFDTTDIWSLDLSNATNLTSINLSSFTTCINLKGNLVIPSSVTNIGNFAFNSDKIENLFFLSQETPGFESLYWKPSIITNKVYVPQGKKDTYISAQNFGFDSSVVEEWAFDSSSSNIFGNFDEINISSSDFGSSSEFSVSGCSPETLSQNAFTWSLVPTGETKSIPNGLWMSKGKINWKNVTEGTYTFKIKSSFDGWSKESDQIITIGVTGDTPIPPDPSPKKFNISLILGLIIGLGIPIILAIVFVIWYLTKKKKMTVRI